MKIPTESNKVPTQISFSTHYEAHFLTLYLLHPTLYLLSNKPLPETRAGTAWDELS
jgi:hypothetical protein